MLTSWECQHCEEINVETDKNKCQKCDIKQTQLSPIGEVMYDQRVLFDGYMKGQIIDELSQDALKIMTADVTSLCNNFFIIDIISLMKQSKNELLKIDDNAWMENEEDKDEADAWALQQACFDLMQNHEYWIADKILKMLLKYDEDTEQHTEYHHMLATSHMEWAKHQQTIDVEYDYLHDQAVNEYEQALELEPQNNDIRKDFARELVNMNRKESAISQYLKIAECDVSIGEDIACAYRDIAICYRSMNDQENMIKYTKLEIKEYESLLPTAENYDMRKKLAIAYQVIKEYKSAIEQYLKLIEITTDSEKSAWCYNCMGDCYKELSDHESAENCYEQAIDFSPDTANYYSDLAGLYENEMKDYSEAMFYYDKTIELDPKNTKRYYDCAFMLRDKVKDYEKAEKYCLKGMEIDDKDPAINGEYGFLMYLKGQYEKALTPVKIAMEKYKENIHHNFNYGYFNHLAGNKDEAERGLENALKLIKTKEEMTNMIESLRNIRETDSESRQYPERFIKIIKDKFG